MPIHDCLACGHAFEAPTCASATVHCPRCRTQELEKKLSVFALRPASSHGAAHTDLHSIVQNPKWLTAMKDRSLALAQLTELPQCGCSTQRSERQQCWGPAVAKRMGYSVGPAERLRAA